MRFAKSFSTALLTFSFLTATLGAPISAPNDALIKRTPIAIGAADESLDELACVAEKAFKDAHGPAKTGPPRAAAAAIFSDGTQSTALSQGGKIHAEDVLLAEAHKVPDRKITHIASFGNNAIGEGENRIIPACGAHSGKGADNSCSKLLKAEGADFHSVEGAIGANQRKGFGTTSDLRSPNSNAGPSSSSTKPPSPPNAAKAASNRHKGVAPPDLSLRKRGLMNHLEVITQ